MIPVCYHLVVSPWNMIQEKNENTCTADMHTAFAGKTVRFHKKWKHFNIYCKVKYTGRKIPSFIFKLQILKILNLSYYIVARYQAYWQPHENAIWKWMVSKRIHILEGHISLFSSCFTWILGFGCYIKTKVLG